MASNESFSKHSYCYKNIFFFIQRLVYLLARWQHSGSPDNPEVEASNPAAAWQKQKKEGKYFGLRNVNSLMEEDQL